MLFYMFQEGRGVRSSAS